MANLLRAAAAAALFLLPPAATAAEIPRWEHVVVVVEENKGFDQIIGRPAAPYLNGLAAAGVNLTRMFGEEHQSEGNYFWLFAGSDMGVGFKDAVPKEKFSAANLGAALLAKQLGFAGYAEALPAPGSEVEKVPPFCPWNCLYGRKHVPWISFGNVPSSANLPFTDFPRDYGMLPTVAFVIPDLENDMHNGAIPRSIAIGDLWLKQHLDGYYRWALAHNSLLIVTFDESDESGNGPTNPAAGQNRIPTILAGAHLRSGYADPTPLNHVNILRTIEAAFGLPKSGAQQPNAAQAGIGDGPIDAAAFTP